MIAPGGRSRARALGLGVVLVALAANQARADVLGVIILPQTERDATLADNLTEVAMARLAESPGRQLVGSAELRRRAGAEAGQHLQACLTEPSCLGSVGVALGVSRVVTGAVRTDGDSFLLTLSLTDIAAGRVEAQTFKRIDGGISAVVRAVQDGVDSLFREQTRPGHLRVVSEPEGARVSVDDVYLGTSPVVSGALAPGSHRVRVEAERYFAWKNTVDVPAGREISLNLERGQLQRRRAWVPYAVYGSAIGAGLCAGTGALFASLSTGTPSGETREAAQADLFRRKTYSRVGIALFISSGLLAALSGAGAIKYRRDLFGE